MNTTRFTAAAALSGSLLLCAAARADGPAKPPSTDMMVPVMKRATSEAM